MDTKKIVIGVALVALLYFVYKHHTEKKSTTAAAGGKFPHIIITYGCSGPEVVALQNKLNELITYCIKNNISISSSLGPGQPVKVVGLLDPDGIYGPATALAMQALFGKQEVYADEIQNLKFSGEAGSGHLDPIFNWG